MHPCCRWIDPAVPHKRALEIAEELFGVVPTGWQRLWLETLRCLISARTFEREFALNFLSLEMGDGVLVLDMPDHDSVLARIARRCANRSRHICRQCGRAGRWRQFGMYAGAVLCARCAAPELLHRAIEDAVQYPGLIAIGGFVNGVDLVPEVLRRPFIAAAMKPNAPNAVPRMDKAELRRWIEQLEAIKTRLPPRHEFAA